MTLTINGFDFGPHILQDSLKQYDIRRQAHDIVALDGTEYRFGHLKRGLSVQLGLVRDDVYADMLAALAVSPAQVTYTDAKSGTRSGVFHVSEPSAAVKTNSGGVDWWAGAGFTLEEK